MRQIFPQQVLLAFGQISMGFIPNHLQHFDAVSSLIEIYFLFTRQGVCLFPQIDHSIGHKGF